MKRSTLFTIMLTSLFPLVGISQNKATIIDDVYFKPGDVKTIKAEDANQALNIKHKSNYKNGAKEIIFRERKGSKQEPIHDTIYVVGQASDYSANTKRSNNSLTENSGNIIHDTIYVTENVAGQLIDSLKDNNEQGYYLNGFNGNESDLEYAERIRRFHDPKYTIMVGSPLYNDIYYLNNNDWNVYLDGPYAYVTPTFTNPTWWDYNFNSYGYDRGFGFGWNNYPWSYNNFYGGFGFGGYYGYGNYYGYGYGYPYYGYDDYYGYGGFGGWYGNSRNRNHDEGSRREISNHSGGNRLGGTRNSASSMMIGGGSNTVSSRSPYTVVSGSRASSTASQGTSATSNVRSYSSRSNGIGVVRGSGTRIVNNTQSSTSGITRTGSSIINTRPRTYSTTISNLPGGNNNSSRNYSTSPTSRSTYSGSSRTNYNNSTSTPTRSTYSTRSSSIPTRSSSPSYSNENPGSSYSGNSNSSSSSRSSSGSGSSSSNSGSNRNSSGGGRR